MASIAIAAILMAIAVNAWGDLREKTRVKSAAEEIRGALTAARLKALSSRMNAQVVFDFTNETVTSPLWTAPHVYQGVDLVAFTCSGPTAHTGIANNTITFTSIGGAIGSAASGKQAVLVRPKGAAAPTYYLVVQSVTGKVRMTKVCP